MVRKYIAPFPNLPKVLVPKLHRLHYGWDHEEYYVRQWCRKHCQYGYYFSPGWQDREVGKFVEFEDDSEALLFALRWA